jgi:dienelactone hydrolase
MSSAARADTREDFLKLIDRPKVDLAPQVDAGEPHDGFIQIRFSFAADAQQRVPGIILKPQHAPANGRLPVVITLHGTGGTKEGMLPLMRDLASRGFLTVAIDAPYHGARTKAGKGSVEYQQAILRVWRENSSASSGGGGAHEHPFYYDTTWDVMRLIDYLQTRDDVDADRIGLIGISKGGIETYLTAAADTRVAVAVPCIGVQSFAWELQHDDWHGRIGTIQTAFDDASKEAGVGHPDSAFVQSFYDRVVPGIADEFDGPKMLTLIAPRPLLVINGDSDDHTPLPSVKLANDAATAAYHAAGADDHFAVKIEEKTAHKVTPASQKEAVEWFAKWLKP